MFPNDALTGYATLGWQAGVVIAAALKHAPATVTSQTVLQGLYAQPAATTFGGWTRRSPSPPVRTPRSSRASGTWGSRTVS